MASLLTLLLAYAAAPVVAPVAVATAPLMVPLGGIFWGFAFRNESPMPFAAEPPAYAEP
jgi:hypothetical protein